MTALIIHGHFYQPPRENPWTGEVEREKGAEPFHDWNERIHAECYGPNAFARILGSEGTVQTVNNYEHISFNFGPTLLSWLERHHRQTYDKILEADRLSSSRRSGHGNAIAQAYGHAILPLANDRDRLTQVLWGVADFRHRFGRDPEALWLPETACNDATLAVLIEQQLRYVILAPDQAAGFKLPESTTWTTTQESRINTSQAYLYRHPDGSDRSISVFFYDGPASRAIAFERVLSSSQLFVDLFKRSASSSRMGNVATDGETYGHHFKFGDLCLAHAMEIEVPRSGFVATNYGEFLDSNPARVEVKINLGPKGEGSSWSCAHGVGRWIRDCGCHTGGKAGWNQSWRGPLRTALEFLNDEAAEQFQTEGSRLMRDPWQARNAYIQVILNPGSRDHFLQTHMLPGTSWAETNRALALLEMQHNALLMFTSCGWFFSDLAGIETVQIMKYAARVLEFMSELKLPSPRERFLALLHEAQSNLVEKGNGEEIFLREAEPAGRVLT